MEINDGGFVTVTVCPVEGAPVTVELDLFRVHVMLQDVIRKAVEKQSDEDYYEGCVGVMQKLGFPTVSWGAAEQFAEQVRAAVVDFKKKGKEESTPASPDSTESTPGN